MNISRILKKGWAFALCLLCMDLSYAQTKDFNTGRALEAQYDILRELQVAFVDTVNTQELIDRGIYAFLSSLDPYTEYIPDEQEEDYEMMRTASYGGIGALIRKIDSLGVQISQPYPGSPAVKYGLEPGDVILEINGEDVKPLPADECSARMKGQPGTEVKFLVRKGRTGEVVEIPVIRERVHISDVSYSGMVKDHVGYIKIDGFTEGGARDVRNAVLDLKSKGAEKLVLDLRGNGGGLMDEAVNILSLFFPTGTPVVSAKGRMPQSNFTLKTEMEPVDTLIPLAVLVNSGSASASEIVSGAIQDLDRGLIVGTRTYGKGLVQGFRPVGYNGKLKLTTAKYYTPSGRCVQAIDYSNRNEDGSVGLVPDSLKKAFKTLKKGRTVYDGGGITPDSLIKADQFSRTAYALVTSGVLGDYATEFYTKHERIAPADRFKLTDEQYEEFVEYASGRKFDARSAASAQFEDVLEAAKIEKTYDLYKEELDALKKKLSLSKEEMLHVVKDEVQALLEDEICTKYYFVQGRIQSMIRTDTQLKKLLEFF